METESGKPLEDWEQRFVGRKDITVLTQPPQTLMGLMQSISQDLADVKRQQARDRAPRLRNAAAQVLLHSCGAQVFKSTSSGYFQQMLASKSAGLQQVAQEMGLTAAELARLHIHPGSRVALDEEVNELLALITPELEQLCPQECSVLRAYESFKKAFPQRFP